MIKMNLFLCWIKMGKKICLLKNDTDQNISLKKWNNRYIAETKGNAVYPEDEAEIVLKPQNFIIINATELDNLWQLKQRLYQVDLNLRVYMGSNTHHSHTLQVADLLVYGGIVFYKTPDNDELQKSLVSRAQLDSRLEQRRRAAAAGCCLLPRFCPWTKNERIQEMEQEIMSIVGRSIGSSYEDIGGSQGTPPMTGGTGEAKCRSGSANLMLMLLDKTGTYCLLSGKEPHERSPIHIGKTEEQFASGVKVKNQVKHKRATNNCCMLEYWPPLKIKKQCTDEMEEKETPTMNDDGTSTADYNVGYCNNRESQDKPPARAGRIEL